MRQSAGASTRMALSRAYAKRERARGRGVLALALALALVAYAYAKGRDARATSRDGSFLDDRGALRRAPPSPSSSSWLSSFLAYLDEGAALTTSGSTNPSSTARGAAHALATKLGARRRGLEIACGDCALVEKLRKDGYDIVGVVPVDGGRRSAAEALAAGAAVETSALHRLPFKEKNFDYVIALEVFERVGERARGETVDPVINELTRVTDHGASMFFATRDDAQSRRWWMDTLCAHGWVEDRSMFLKLVEASGAASQKPDPQRWFFLRRARKIKDRGRCSCAVPKGYDSERFCGGSGRPNARDEVRAYWRSLKKSDKTTKHRTLWRKEDVGT